MKLSSHSRGASLEVLIISSNDKFPGVSVISPETLAHDITTDMI